jgi:long-chain acyl-CoA synthetase
MVGYWQRERETQSAFTADGYFRTGDIAVQEPDGYLRIVDRAKDLIIISGFNVYPNEIEDVVSSHPDVLECAAVGVADEKSGEAVRLFVVSRNESLDAAEIRAWCKERLTGYKVPREVMFTHDLPKSNIGKVLRRKLRDGDLGAEVA